MRQLLKSFMYKVLEDIWGFVLMICISMKIREDKFTFLLIKLLNPYDFLSGLCKLPQTPERLEIRFFMTLYFIICLFSIILTLAILLLYIYFPFILKILTSFMLPAIIYFYFKTINYTDYTYYILGLSCVYSLYRICYVFQYHNSQPYNMAYKLAVRSYNLPLNFFLCLFFAYTMILVDTIVIMWINFSLKDSFINSILFKIYYFLNLNTISYSHRIKIAEVLCSSDIPGFRQGFILDFIANYFNSKVVAIFIPISSVLDMYDSWIYRPFFKIADSESKTFLEKDSSIIYSCMIHRKSLIGSFNSSKKILWHGELRKKMKCLSLRQDFFPCVVLFTALIFMALKPIKLPYFGSNSIFIVVFSHISIAVEVINSNFFTKLYKSSYGLPLQTKHISQTSPETFSEDIPTSTINMNG